MIDTDNILLWNTLSEIACYRLSVGVGVSIFRHSRHLMTANHAINPSWVDDALDWMKDEAEKNKNIDNYIKGE